MNPLIPDYDLPPAPCPEGARHKRMDTIGAIMALGIGGPLLLALAFLGVVMSAGTHSPEPAAPVTQAEAAPALPADNDRGFVMHGEWHTVEYWLSIIDGSTKEEDYGYLLDALQAKFPGPSRRQIGNYLMYGQDELKKKGINESLSEFGWHVDECVPKSMAGTMKFPEVAAIYMTLKAGER